MIGNIDRGEDAHRCRYGNQGLESVTGQGEIGGALRQALAAQVHVAGSRHTLGEKLLSSERGREEKKTKK